MIGSDVKNDKVIGVDVRAVTRMIVAGTRHEHKSSAPRAFTTHHERQFRVRLEFEETIDHLHAGPFEVASPADIGLFIETRTQLNQEQSPTCRLRPPRPGVRTIGELLEVRYAVPA